MSLLKKMLIWIAAIIAALIVGVLLLGWFFSAPAYNGPDKEYFNGKTFENLNGEEAKSFLNVIKWAITSDPEEWTKIPESEVDFHKPAERVADSIVVTFVNHSTFLIQSGNLNILTDPIWSERASPFTFAGPKRMTPPGILFEDLPPIDLVILSHNHYDHLDISTLKKINEKFGSKFITPLGVQQYLNNNGISNTTDLGWWDEHTFNDSLGVVSVPAQHFSARGLFDKNKTLWAGYVLRNPAGNIYFAGDTGYGEFFKEIGERFPIKLGLIPIGAYKPKWFMSPVHISPEEAVLAHYDVGAETSIGMHYNSFPLADDGRMDPLIDLKDTIENIGENKPDFRLLKEGESITIK